MYDIKDPARLRRVAGVPTRTGLFHLFPLAEGRLLGSHDADSLVHFGSGVSGNAVLYAADADGLHMLKETKNAGGRAATLLSRDGLQLLVCDGGVFRVGKSGIKQVFSFMSGGSTLDGASYAGDSEGQYAALALDGVAVLIKMKDD